MIKSDRKRSSEIIFNFYIKSLLKRNFSHFYQINEFPKIKEDTALVVTPNHISWWDGFFIGYLNTKVINRVPNIMMLEEQLKDYAFFKKVGAYSINPANSRSILETVKYTHDLLKNNKNLIIIYPQGIIQPFEKKPIILKQGIKKFLRNGQDAVNLLPIAFKIQYANEKKPDIFVRFGKVFSSEILDKDFTEYEREFNNNIDETNIASYSKEIIYKNIFE